MLTWTVEVGITYFVSLVTHTEVTIVGVTTMLSTAAWIFDTLIPKVTCLHTTSKLNLLMHLSIITKASYTAF